MGKLIGLAFSMIGIVQLLSAVILFFLLSELFSSLTNPTVAPYFGSEYYVYFYIGCAFAILQLSTGIIALIAGIKNFRAKNSFVYPSIG